MAIGSLAAHNLLGGERGGGDRVEEKEPEKENGDMGWLSQVAPLWNETTGKIQSEKDGGLSQVTNLWNSTTGQKEVKKMSGIRIYRDYSGKNKSIHWGPGGALGVGCGVGIGVGLTGGAGVGATPSSVFRILFGVGAGCGVGLGYGYGYGMGFRWDWSQKKLPKRIIIEF